MNNVKVVGKSPRPGDVVYVIRRSLTLWVSQDQDDMRKAYVVRAGAHDPTLLTLASVEDGHMKWLLMHSNGCVGWVASVTLIEHVAFL